MVSIQNPIDANVARPAGNGLGRLAAWCYDHRRRVLLGWLLAVVAITGLAQWAGSRLDNNFALSSSPSQQAQNLLASRFPSQKGDSADVVLRSSSRRQPCQRRGYRPAGEVSATPATRLWRAKSARPGWRPELSPGRRIGFVVVQFDATAADLPAGAVHGVIDTADGFAHPGLQVAVGGAPVEQVVSAAPGSSVMIGLLAAIVIMLLAFGSVVAMGLPILTALFGVAIGFGILMLLSHLVTVPTFGPEHGDHDRPRRRHRLRPVRRHPLPPGAGRATDRHGRPPSWPLATAGRAVLFAGCTVVIALLGHVRARPAVRGRPRRRRRSSPSSWCWRPRSPCCRRCSASPGPASTGCTSPACSPGPATTGQAVLVPLEPDGAAPAVDLRGARAGRPGGAGPAAVLHAPGVHRRRQRPDLAHHPAGLRPAGRASAPGATGPLVVAVDLPTARTRRPASPGSTRASATRPASPRRPADHQPGRRRRGHHRRIPTTSPQDRRRPPSWSTGCAIDVIPRSPPAPAVTGLRRR